MKSPPNTYVLLALGLLGAFFIPALQKRLEKKMSKMKAFLLSFTLFLIFGILGLFIVEAVFDL